MDAAKRFENHETCIFNEFVHPNNDEEVIVDDGLAFVQLEPGTLEIEIDEQMLQEFGDWIAIRVRFLLDDLDQIFQCITASRIDDNGSSQITQNVRAHRLDGIQVQWLIQEHFDDQITSLGMIDEDEHTPVNQPGALLQSFDIAANENGNVEISSVSMVGCGCIQIKKNWFCHRIDRLT